MANEKRLIDAKKLPYSIAVDDNGKQIFYVKATDIDNAPTVDAVEVSMLGKLGRLMMPYKGCPRGAMGARGAAGCETTETEMLIMELDPIRDIDGNWWIPVLADDLVNLKERVTNAVEVVHAQWLYDGGSGCYFCSACDEYAIVQLHRDWDGTEYYEECLTNYCPNCGAKMDGDGNG